MYRSLNKILLFGLIGIFASCSRPSTPKPYGYFRIDVPAHSYQEFPFKNYPYRFEVPSCATLDTTLKNSEPYWMDIYYPHYNARIHCSYKPIRGNLPELLDDAVKFVFDHAGKASAIPEQAYIDEEKRVYCVNYDLNGNTASPAQFYMTDSVHHFFRGALYFNNIPNEDSVAPICNFIREDIRHIIETFEWSNGQTVKRTSHKKEK